MYLCTLGNKLFGASARSPFLTWDLLERSWPSSSLRCRIWSRRAMTSACCWLLWKEKKKERERQRQRERERKERKRVITSNFIPPPPLSIGSHTQRGKNLNTCSHTLQWHYSLLHTLLYTHIHIYIYIPWNTCAVSFSIRSSLSICVCLACVYCLSNSTICLSVACVHVCIWMYMYSWVSEYICTYKIASLCRSKDMQTHTLRSEDRERVRFVLLVFQLFPLLPPMLILAVVAVRFQAAELFQPLGVASPRVPPSLQARAPKVRRPGTG